jgi:WD40 repeat protein
VAAGASLARLSAIVGDMAGPGMEGERAEIARMQDGVKALVSRTVRGGPRLRGMSAPTLLSLLCATAFSPLLVVGAGITGAMAVAGVGILSSVGGNVLSGVLVNACNHLHSGAQGKTGSPDGLEEEIARQIERVLAAEDSNARALMGEIAVVLRKIDAGATMLEAAIVTGSQATRRDVIAAISSLESGLAEMRFLLDDVRKATALIVKNQDEQSAQFRALSEQRASESADYRMALEDLTATVRWSRAERTGDGNADRTPSWEGRCPYRGLAPYREADAEVFYGRERVTTALASKLAQQLTRGGLVVVTGASGIGKSSLLRAGLMPALARGVQVTGSQYWPRIVLTPTKDPLTELAARLAQVGGRGVAEIREELSGHPDQAHLTIRQTLIAHQGRRDYGPIPAQDDTARLVVVVDQFEQLLTLSGTGGAHEQRESFVRALRIAGTRPCGPAEVPAAVVVIAVRGDLWYRCVSSYPQLADAFEDGRFTVGPMNESDLRRAVTGPADAAELRIEPGLIDAIMSDLRAAGSENAVGVLPLLSQAMLLTWEKRDGDRLTSHGYGQAGGVGRAVQTSAEDTYNTLPAEQQPLARDLLRAMTVTSRTGRPARRPVIRADLYTAFPSADKNTVNAVLEAFAAKRLLVLDGDTVQISHDALLTAWPRLSGWMEDERASWILYGQLADDAAAWQERDRDASFLCRGTQLAAFQQAVRQWSADTDRYPVLSSTQDDFLRASERAAARGARLRKSAIAILAVLTVVVTIAFAVAAQQGANARRQTDQAIYNQTIAEALQLVGVNTSLAAQLELTAYHIQAAQGATSRLLNFENSPLPTPLTGLPAAVESVASSPDGRVLASGSSDGTVQLWDMSNPARPQPLGAPFAAATGVVDSVAFSPRGSILATGSGDGAVRLWDVSDPADPVPLGQPLAGSASYVLSVSFSWNGRMLASGGSDGTIHLWDVTSPAHARPLGSPVNASTGPVNSVAFSRDGRVLASGGGDGTVRLWDVAHSTDIRLLGQPLTGSGAAVTSVAFSFDEYTLASGGGDGAVRLWDVANPRNPRLLGPPVTASTGTVDSVAFSQDGRMLASGGRDGAVRLWDVANPAAPQPLGPSLTGPADSVSSVAFIPDGSTLAVGSTDHSIWLWNLPRTILVGHTAAADSVAFSPNGHTLASGSSDQTARLWDVTNLANPEPLGVPLTGPTGTVDSVAFSPTSRTLATGSFDGTIRLWNTADPVHPHLLGPPLIDTGGNVLTLAFSPNGRTLAVGSSDDSVRLWDVTDPASPQAFSQTLASHDTIAAVAFSPDGHLLASGSYDRTVRLWDVTNPAHPWQLGTLLTSSAERTLSVAFSPDGHLLASGSYDGTVRLWDVTHPAHPRLLGSPLTGPVGPVNSVAFSKDSRTLAIGSSDGTIWLWNVSDPADPVSDGPPLTGSGAAITSVAFSPDKQTLASASYDGTVRLWNLSVTYAADRICAAADNALTSFLWHKYIPQLPYQPPCSASVLKTPASPTASATGPVPDTPSSVRATATGQRTITVTWAESSSDVTGYNVDNGCPVSPAGTCGGSDTSLARTTGRTTSAEFAVTPGAYDCFRVQAFNKSGASNWSGYGCAETPWLTVTGTREWTDTGVNLPPDARLYMKAIGLIYIDSATPESPEGNPACEPAITYPAVSPDFLAPTLPCWSLVARIGNGPPLEVGSSTLIITTPGRLYLGINDDSFTNNSGSWIVVMKIGGAVNISGLS